jgi:hypothetical protein
LEEHIGNRAKSQRKRHEKALEVGKPATSATSLIARDLKYNKSRNKSATDLQHLAIRQKKRRSCA